MDKPLIFHILLLLSSLSSLYFHDKVYIELNRSDRTAETTVMLAVEIEASAAGSLPNQTVGYCQSGRSTVTFTNKGMANDPAQSIISDLTLGIALGNNFQLANGGFQITSVSIAGVNMASPSPLNSIANSPFFSSDPDGPGGLSDADNDGFFDDLQLGQKVEISIEYIFDWTQASANTPNTNCLNNASTNLNARFGYMENGQARLFSFENYLRPANENTLVENFTEPDAFSAIDTFTMIHTESRRLRSFATDCSDGQFEITITVPSGITPITHDFVLWKNQTDAAPLISADQIGNLLTLVYDASFTNLLSGEYSLEMAFTSNCSVPDGPTVFPISFYHYCLNCDCRHLWYCGDLDGPTFHPSSPPCTSDVLIECPKGVQTQSFEVNRTTFGFADKNYTTPFNPSNANTKVALPCDKISMKVVSKVGETPINDSIGVIIKYSNPTAFTSIQSLFLFENGNVQFTHAGNEFNCQVDAAMLTENIVGVGNTLHFDLHECLVGLGFSLTEGDIVEFTAAFSINPSGPISNDFLIIPDFRAYGFSTVDGVEVSCDNFGETFRIGRTRALYDFPNTGQSSLLGCGQGEWHYRLFVPENDFVDFFGNEFRASQKIDSFVFDFNPLLLEAYSDLSVMVSIPGHPFHGNNYFSIKPLSDFPSGHYVAVFDTLNYVPPLNVVEEYTLDIKLNATPTCKAKQFNNIAFNSKVNYQDRFYAANIGNSSCVLSKMEIGNTTISYASPPQIELSLLTPPADTVEGGQAEWIVQICNTSNSTELDVIWFAFEDLTTSLNVLSAENITDPNSPVNIPLLPFGANNQFNFTPSLSANNCIRLRLRATIAGCQNLDFKFKSGWNCSASSQPNWTPADNVCDENTIDLVIVSTDSSPLEMTISEVTSTCQGSGEKVTIEGGLTTLGGTVTDDFLIQFFDDENGNEIAEPTEAVIFQENIVGAITSANPLVFSASFDITASQSCHLIAVLQTTNIDLCEEVILKVPTPQLVNAGEDQSFCLIASPVLMTEIGNSDCLANGYNYSWKALPPASINDINTPNAATTNLTVNWGNLLGEDLTYILETQRTGCGNSTFDTVVLSMPNAANGYFAADSLLLQANDCQSQVEFCLGIPQNEIGDFEVLVNNSPYPSANFTNCTTNQVAVGFSPGSFNLILSNNQNGCSDTVFIKVNCTETESINLTLLLNEPDTVCLHSGELSGPIMSISNICEDGTFVEYEILDDSCVILTGVALGAESACWVACDANNFCDTTIINSTVLHPFPNGISDTIIIATDGEYCFNASQLNIVGDIFTIENICQDQTDTSVAFTIDPINYCIFYDGLLAGTDTACLNICDEFNNCDTVQVLVTVVPGFTVLDTVFITVDTNTFCLPDSLLPGDIVLVEDVCPENNAEQVIFEINGNCVDYYGTGIGTDTACIKMMDEFGNVALYNLIVTVVRTTPETICDQIYIRETKEFCLDTLELPGIYTGFNILYDNPNPNNVTFDPNPVNLCVRYEGLEIGRDSFGIALCDQYGYCDTTTFCITVNPYFDPPSLVDDSTTTFLETPVLIDPLANDTVFGGLRDFYILTQPISGSAVLNLDGSVTYIPGPSYCARWDQFDYVVCNPNGCDTATINIFIECIELTIFNAVSPNNDDVNDYFYIAKIENFPNNRLWIYNRWGSLVFDTGKEGYKNNWPGTWGKDIDLPDGSYYFILEWSDNGVSTVQRGFFEMVR